MYLVHESIWEVSSGSEGEAQMLPAFFAVLLSVGALHGTMWM